MERGSSARPTRRRVLNPGEGVLRSGGMSGDQLQPQDTLDDRGVDDVLDEGISPPEELRGSKAKGVTPAEAVEGETIDDRHAIAAGGAHDDALWRPAGG